MTASETGIGGLREVIFEVRGDGAYSRLKYEGGVHRVQRVPETESSGRIHTSTATVAVLPEADEVDVQIDEARTCASTSSAHPGRAARASTPPTRRCASPTCRPGLVVEIQDEKSQHKNKAKAMPCCARGCWRWSSARRTRQEAAARRSMVGSGERSEKIRTYNFPQDRVTDHRIDMDLHNLPSVLDGDLDRLLDALIQDRPGTAAGQPGGEETGRSP